MQPKLLLGFSYISVTTRLEWQSKLKWLHSNWCASGFWILWIHVVHGLLHDCKIAQAHTCWVEQGAKSVSEQQLCRCHILSPIVKRLMFKNLYIRA